MARFTGSQYALGQFHLPFGTVTSVAQNLASEWLNASQPEHQQSILRRSRILQTAGACDLVVEIEPDSFRRLPEASALLAPQNSGGQWTLGKEIRFEEKIAQEYAAEIDANLEDPLSFVIFLRIERSIYFDGGGVDADNAIISQIEEALKGRAREGRISAGLGWTDFIVIGTALNGRTGVFEILENLLQMDYKGKPALHRSITLVGYEWQKDGVRGPTGPIPGYGLKIRLRPYAVGQVYNRLKDFCEKLIVGDANEEDYTLTYTGGKRDIIFLPRVTLKMKSLLTDEDDRKKWLQLASDVRVEHMETNFLLNYWIGDEGRDIDPKPFLHITNPQPPVKDSPPFASKVNLPELKDRIPDGVLQSLHGIYALIHAALNDDYKRPDIETAVLACDGVLAETLEELLWLWTGITPDGVNAQKLVDLTEQQRFVWRERYFEDLKIWCSRVEKVIGERAAGNLESKMIPLPSLAPYRGHTNKILVTADLLVREFISRAAVILNLIDENGDPTVSPPAFHLGASDMIESDLRAGVVTLPSKYMFSLVLAVPQLWSESGVRIFHRVYRVPFSGIVASRVHEFLSVSEEEDVSQPPPSKHDLVAELADHYADLVVRFFGLETTKMFTVYLVSMTTIHLRFRDDQMGDARRRQAWFELLVRLLFTYEANAILQSAPGSKKVKQDEFDFDGATYRDVYWPEGESATQQTNLDYLREIPSHDRAGILEKLLEKILILVDEIQQTATQSGSQQGTFPWPNFDEKIRKKAKHFMLSSPYSCCHWQFQCDFVEAVLGSEGIPDAAASNQDFQKNVERLTEGHTVDLHLAKFVNGYLAEGYASEAAIRLAGQARRPAGMAALGRSAFLAFLAQRQSDSAGTTEDSDAKDASTN